MENLRKHMEEKGISITYLAKILGISRDSLYKWIEKADAGDEKKIDEIVRGIAEYAKQIYTITGNMNVIGDNNTIGSDILELQQIILDQSKQITELRQELKKCKESG